MSKGFLSVLKLFENSLRIRFRKAFERVRNKFEGVDECNCRVQ